MSRTCAGNLIHEDNVQPPETPYWQALLHDWRNRNPHNCQRAHQFPPDDGYRGQQELLPLFVRLAEDRVAMIERIKKLSQLKHVLGQGGGLDRGDSLLDKVRSFRACKP